MQDFGGIAQKLQRAEENIGNLYSEIETFFKEGNYAILPQNDPKVLLEAIQYHKNRVIPVRFSVLAGEVIHHFRSCFDHVVWHFSIGPKHNIRQIEFPVFEGRPVNHDSRALYERKIQAITDPNVIALIEGLQPYKSSDPLDDPLFIIHDFDIVDKHRELVLCFPKGLIMLPPEMRGIVESYKREHPELDSAQVAHHFQSHGTLRPSISFRNFGRREFHPVIPGLMDLFNYTVNAIKRFEAL